MPRARIFRTSSFRLTVLYAILFCALALTLFAAIYYQTAGYMARQLDRSINAEISILEDERLTGGTSRLAALIEERQSETPRSGTVYLLQDAAGLHLAGNLPPRRPIIGWFTMRGRSRAAEGEAPHRIRARGITLDDGSYLVVGQDASRLDEIRGLIVRSFGWGITTTVVLAIFGGMLMSAGVLRRVASVARTSQAIMQGDLSQRIQSRGVGDEFDQLAGALNAMLARIETLMQGLRQVSNDIAHDLRTPLSRLRQRFEAMQRSSPSVQDYENLVDRSIHDIDAILETFAAILRIAEIEAASRKSGFSDVDLSSVLVTIVEVYEPLTVEKSQNLAGRIAPGLVVRGDQELLTQLLANLVENALTHTPAGTQVAVEAGKSGGAVEVAVSDTGPGIPEDQRDKVFRRFYRLEASRSTPGSGLGLSLVAAIAALHGIEIDLSNNNPGLRVRMRFPALSPTRHEVTS